MGPLPPSLAAFPVGSRLRTVLVMLVGTDHVWRPIPFGVRLAVLSRVQAKLLQHRVSSLAAYLSLAPCIALHPTLRDHLYGSISRLGLRARVVLVRRHVPTPVCTQSFRTEGR